MLLRGAISRVVRSAIAAEIKLLRPQDASLPDFGQIDEDFLLKGGPHDFDSLEFVSLATAIAGQFNVYEAAIEDNLLRYREVRQWIDLLCTPSVVAIDALSFSTSGTTGVRKRVRHPNAWLQQETQAWAALLGGRRRMVVMCPTHHIFGCIWGVLLADTLSLPVVDASVESIHAGLIESGDLIVTVPAIWNYFAGSGFRFANDVIGISSTAMLGDPVAEALEERGLTRLMQIYGSSETAGLAWRDTANAPYRLLTHWSRQEVHDAADEPEMLVRACPDGKSRLLAAPDVLQWHDDRQFSVVRRRDHAVQVGGHNVSPAWVRERLCEQRNVADAAVRTFDANGETRLKAFIVLREDTESARHEIAFWTTQALPAHSRPKALSFGSALPTNAMGKFTDWTA